MQSVVKRCFAKKLVFYFGDTVLRFSNDKSDTVQTETGGALRRHPITVVLGAPHVLYYVHDTDIATKEELRFADKFYLGFSRTPDVDRLIYGIDGLAGKKILVHAHLSQDARNFMQKFKHARFVPLPLFVFIRSYALTSGNAKTEHYAPDDELFSRDRSLLLHTGWECLFYNAGLQRIKYCNLKYTSLVDCQNLYGDIHPKFYNSYTGKISLTDEASMEAFLSDSAAVKKLRFPKIGKVGFSAKKNKNFNFSVKGNQALLAVAAIIIFSISVLLSLGYRRYTLEADLKNLRQRAKIGVELRKKSPVTRYPTAVFDAHARSTADMFDFLRVTDKQKGNFFWIESVRKKQNRNMVLILYFLKKQYVYKRLNDYLRALNMTIVRMETSPNQTLPESILNIKLELKPDNGG